MNNLREPDDELSGSLAHCFVAQCRGCATITIYLGRDELISVVNVCSAIVDRYSCQGRLDEVAPSSYNREKLLEVFAQLSDGIAGLDTAPKSSEKIDLPPE